MCFLKLMTLKGIISILCSVISTFYYIRIVKTMYFDYFITKLIFLGSLVEYVTSERGHGAQHGRKIGRILLIFACMRFVKKLCFFQFQAKQVGKTLKKSVSKKIEKFFQVLLHVRRCD